MENSRYIAGVDSYDLENDVGASLGAICIGYIDDTGVFNIVDMASSNNKEEFKELCKFAEEYYNPLITFKEN